MVDLAASVELVAEQVEKQQRLGLHMGHDMNRRKLVVLEYAPLNGRRGQKRRRNARRHVCPRPVTGDPLAAVLHRMGKQVGCRRLAVGSTHDDVALGRARPELVEHMRIYRKRNAPGERRGIAVEDVL